MQNIKFTILTKKGKINPIVQTSASTFEKRRKSSHKEEQREWLNRKAKKFL